MHRSHDGSQPHAETTLRTSAAFRSLRRPYCAQLAAHECGPPLSSDALLCQHLRCAEVRLSVSPEAVLRAEASGLLNVDEAQMSAPPCPGTQRPTLSALRRNRAARHRHRAARAWHDMRDWRVERRRRSRHLIELGGLVVKSGVVELTGDDRAVIYGAPIWAADKLGSDESEGRASVGPRRGSRRSKPNVADERHPPLRTRLRQATIVGRAAKIKPLLWRTPTPS